MKIVSKEEGGIVFVAMKGSIGESAEDSLDEILARVDGQHVQFDCGGITHINSIGIAGWMRFIKQVDSQKFSFQNCPSVFIEYMNLITGVVGNGSVDSVKIACRCPSCEIESNMTIEVASLTDVGSLENIGNCGKCNSALETDVDEDDYKLLVS